jgi:uncharacterized LabA/DUF88 family protein
MSDLLKIHVNGAFAAIFVDYENVYYHLRNRYADIPELSDFVVELLMNLQKHLEEKFGLRSIIAKAYADYERIKATPQGSLYLMGVETVYVLGTEHKNAADMKLCIDAMEVLYTRSEIETFVVFAGDRDYIPLIQHLKKQAKSVIAVGFEGSFSGDLMTNVGRANFVDATALLSQERLDKLEEIAQKHRDYEIAEAERDAERTRELQERNTASENAQEAQKRAFEEQSKPSAIESLPAGGGDAEVPEKGDKETSVASPAPASQAKTASTKATPEDKLQNEGFNIPITELTDEERACLSLMVSQFGNYYEIFLSPFLRKLSDALPNLADWQRKGLLGDLEFKGAVKMEKRSGIPYDYTVVILNYNHPVVREMC